jgi:NADPH:quinone reductase
VEAVGELEGSMVLVRGAGLGTTRDGLYAELAAVPRASAIPVPEGADPKQVAGLGVPGPTAWALVHEVARITSEDRVLVLGATGGVGAIAVQLARATGASVWGQTSSAGKLDFLQSLGVDRAVLASAETVAAEVGDLQATVVLDPLADGFTVAAIEAVQPFGRIALYGASAGPLAEVDLRTLYRKGVQLLGYSGTIEPEERLRNRLERTLEALVRGELRVPIDDVLPLERAPEAHRRIKERQVRGKLLLAP